MDSDNGGEKHAPIDAETAAEKRSQSAERLAQEACRFIVKRNKFFPRFVVAERCDILDSHQIDILLETKGTIAIELQVKSSNNAVARHYKKQRNRRILAFNVFRWDENITPMEFSYVLELLSLTALTKYDESPYEWYFLKAEEWDTRIQDLLN
jgi:hypothetical protein